MEGEQSAVGRKEIACGAEIWGKKGEHVIPQSGAHVIDTRRVSTPQSSLNMAFWFLFSLYQPSSILHHPSIVHSIPCVFESVLSLTCRYLGDISSTMSQKSGARPSSTADGPLSRASLATNPQPNAGPSRRQQEFNAGKQYVPFSHDPANKGAITGRPMPQNVPRRGPDNFEDIDEFFKSPAANTSRFGGINFSALSDTPGGPSSSPYLSGSIARSGGGSPLDVNDVVNQALRRDMREGMGGSLSPQEKDTPSKRYVPLARASSTSTSFTSVTSTRKRSEPQLSAVFQQSYDSLPSPNRPQNRKPSRPSQAAPQRSVASEEAQPAERDDDGEIEAFRRTDSRLSQGRRSSVRPVPRTYSSPMRDELAKPKPVNDASFAADTTEYINDEVFGGGQDAYSDDAMGGAVDETIVDDGDNGLSNPHSLSPGSDLHQDQQEEEEEEEAPVRRYKSKGRTSTGSDGSAKRPRVVAMDEDEEEEQHFQNGQDDHEVEEAPMDDVFDEDVQYEDDEPDYEEAPLRPPPVEKVQPKAKEVKPRKKPKVTPAPTARHTFTDVNSDDDQEDDGSGQRRSRRRRFPVLEYWRGERMVFGRKEHGTAPVPVYKGIIDPPKPPPQHLSRVGRARSKKSRAGSSVPRGTSVKRDGDLPEETGWDQDTSELGLVMDYVTKTDVERRIAFPSHMLSYRTMPGDTNGFKFQKVFGDASFVASGMLEIPVGSEKPSKPTKDNTYLFIVLEGAVSVKIHRTMFTMAPLGQFMVPRGNQYSITTISRRPAKLFFAQARKMAADEDEVMPIGAPPSSHPTSRKGDVLNAEQTE